MKAKSFSNIRLLNEEDPRIEYTENFFKNEQEITTLVRMAKDMGYHRSGMLDPPQQVTFLPMGDESYSYEFFFENFYNY